jgi:hypothetical protein
MNQESTVGQSSDFELATWGEVLGAFKALRSITAQRNGRRSTRRLWEDELPELLRTPQTICSPKEDRTPAPVRAKAIAVEPAGKRRRDGGRCRCGLCRSCMDNERWERIFREKFATPDYYRGEIRVSYPSPLSGF